PALDLVGHCQGGEELLATLAGIFACGQNCPEVVTGVAGFSFSNVAVVVVEVANQGCIVESSPVRSRLASSNQGNKRLAPEVLDLLSNHLYRRSIESANGTAKGI